MPAPEACSIVGCMRRLFAAVTNYKKMVAGLAVLDSGSVGVCVLTLCAGHQEEEAAKMPATPAIMLKGRRMERERWRSAAISLDGLLDYDEEARLCCCRDCLCPGVCGFSPGQL